MILDFYNLTEPPFGVTPDPQFLYLGKTHREALASLLHGLTAGRGFTALIAGAGMGKTALLRLIAQKLQASTRTAFLPNSHCTPREFLASLLTSLGVEAGDDTFLAMHTKLNESLVREYNSQNRFVVIIDEAQDLGEPTLELLRVLSNVETPREKLMHFVLSGHPQLAQKLASPQLIQLRQRVSIIARLEPFDAEETRLYIDHRLRIAGYDFARPLFSPTALELIADYSRGVPRNINNVCFNALSLGFVKRRQTIEVDVIHEVLEDLDLQSLIEAGGEVPFIPRSRHDSEDVTEGAINVGSSGDASDFRRLHVDAGLSSNPSLAYQPGRDADLRRSSRIAHPVSLMVLGTDRLGESFEEETSAVSLNLHGCSYCSRHNYHLGSWVTLQIGGANGAGVPHVRAQVRSVSSSKSPHELCQVGVELETPANVWGVTAPPADWKTKTEFKKWTDLAASSAATKNQALTATENEAMQGHVAAAFAQILPVLEDRLQQSAERFVQSAVVSRLDESLRDALTRIDDFWKANASRSEEVVAARMAEMRERWEDEAAAHRGRVEETSKRLELLGAKAGQGLLELQRFVTRIKSEIESQFDACLNQSLRRAASEFETIATHVSERHHAEIDQASQAAMRAARSQLDDTVAETRSLGATAPASIPEERVESLIDSSRGEFLKHVGECLADIYRQLDQQQEQARRRTEEFAQQLEQFSAALRDSQTRNEQSVTEVRTLVASRDTGVSLEHLDSRIQSERELIFKHLESKLSDASNLSDQRYDFVGHHSEEMARQMETLEAKTQDASAQHEQSVAELRSLVAGMSSGPSQEYLEGVLETTRGQLSSQLESRIYDVADEVKRSQEGIQQQVEEISRKLEQLATEAQTRLIETRELAERTSHASQSHAEILGTIEESAQHAVQEIENSAASISNRQVVRMMELKQALARELALDLEAKASETRAAVEKSASAALEDFQRRLELQNDLIIGDATQRVASTLASLDADYRSTREMHHQTLKAEVARAAEQSMTEFRSGMKAFLYSCLVAAVSAVDQHAQTTLGSLSQDPNDSKRKLDAASEPAAQHENRSSAASAT